MDSSPSLVFGGNADSETDEVWDDSLLIDLYQESVKLVEKKLRELEIKKPANVETSPKAKSKSPSPIQSQGEKEEGHQTPEQSPMDQPDPIIQPGNGIPTPPQINMMSGMLPESPVKEDDALASMLMSWYMCGYQTGYYAALKQTSNNKPS